MGRKEEAAVPLSRGVGSPSNTIWHEPGPTFVPSVILIYSAVWPQESWAENWRAVPYFGGAGSPPNNVAWAKLGLPLYQVIS